MSVIPGFPFEPEPVVDEGGTMLFGMDGEGVAVVGLYGADGVRQAVYRLADDLVFRPVDERELPQDVTR